MLKDDRKLFHFFRYQLNKNRRCIDAIYILIYVPINRKKYIKSLPFYKKLLRRNTGVILDNITWQKGYE